MRLPCDQLQYRYSFHTSDLIFYKKQNNIIIKIVYNNVVVSCAEKKNDFSRWPAPRAYYYIL